MSQDFTRPYKRRRLQQTETPPSTPQSSVSSYFSAHVHGEDGTGSPSQVEGTGLSAQTSLFVQSEVADNAPSTVIVTGEQLLEETVCFGMVRTFAYST